MKIQHFLLFLLLFSGIVACTIDPNSDGPEYGDSYFYASLDGPSWNGEMTINGDSTELFAQAVITPSGDSIAQDIISITYNDTENNTNVTIRVPAKEGITEITEAIEKYGVGLDKTDLNGEYIVLAAKTVSVEITKLKTSNDFLGFSIAETVIGNFTGIMIRRVVEGGVEVEEAHSIKGDFEYYFF